jgi:ABC-type transport system involved in cytochrome bd biosynthesis fused ATPase/permease subunit
MSERNLSMKDMFEVEKRKTPDSRNAALEKTREAATLKEELAKKSKLIQWSVVRDVLFDKTVEMLDIPLLTFLQPAWKKYREIMDFADTEKYPPNETELVSLAEHTITVKHQPYLQVTYRGVEIPNVKLTFTLKADLTLQGVILKIKNGKIIAINGGAVTGSGELLLEDQSIFKQPFGSYELLGSIDLGDGIPLRGTPDSHAATASGN